MLVSNENVISARLLSDNYTECVPRTSREHVSLLIYKICEYIRKNPAIFTFPNTYVEQTDKILGQKWSEFIDEVNQVWEGCPKPLMAPDALILLGYYKKFVKEFVVDRERCEKINSLIATCPYLLVVDDDLCVSNDKKQLLTTHIEMLNMNSRVKTIFLGKATRLGLKIENRNITVQCIARKQMFYLMDMLGQIQRVSINSEKVSLLTNRTEKNYCTCTIV